MNCLTTRGNGGAAGSGTALHAGKSRVRFPTGIFEFLLSMTVGLRLPVMFSGG